MSKEKAKADAISRAKTYILAHQDESKMQQSVGSGFSEPTIARARAELVRDGLIPASRKKETPSVGPAVRPVSEAPSPQAPAPTGGNVDAQAMQALADMIDAAASEEDDGLVHKRLLKQCLLFAFDTRLHPDTRMSASQMWSKLKDQTKARELGPGKPKTFDDAVARLSELQVACGLDVVLAAVQKTLDALGVANEGHLPTNDDQATPGAIGATPAS